MKIKSINYVKKNSKRASIGFLILLSFLYIAILHGLVPFKLSPTLGQLLWTSGFANSLSNSNNSLAIYAKNIGYPKPAPIAFGLSGAFPTSLLIKTGLHPMDAYIIMALFWVYIAFFGAYLLSNRLSNDTFDSILSALIWSAQPIIWKHSGYSMLSLGIALLPFYFYSTYTLNCIEKEKKLTKKLLFFFFSVLTSIISVFMDGYTFVMFALLSMIFLGINLIKRIVNNFELKYFIPFILQSMILIGSYFLYASYIGMSQFPKVDLEQFRAWGMDLTFFFTPTSGVFWLWDKFGLAVERSTRLFYGDKSVWETTFTLPMLIAVVLTFRKRINNMTQYIFILLFILSFFLSLGPSIKLGQVKPKDYSGNTMPLNHVKYKSGLGILYEQAPAFSNMRATYRWNALSVFCLWFLFAINLNNISSYKKKVLIILLLLFIAPDLKRHVIAKRENYIDFKTLEYEVIKPLDKVLCEKEIVAFLPRNNDFLVNYIAPSTNIFSLNIGGDKNYEYASRYWPKEMNKFEIREIGNEFSRKAIDLLKSTEVDAIVFSKIDTLEAAHSWPSPKRFQKRLENELSEIYNTPGLSFTETNYFFIMREKASCVSE
ncbi:MAG: hypothetical protein GF381_02060 [Candidatus Pacebacteria bacterium]|nr:hypothetical protein [Candidatus Paceibacterota bacterium]